MFWKHAKLKNTREKHEESSRNIEKEFLENFALV